MKIANIKRIIVSAWGLALIFSAFSSLAQAPENISGNWFSIEEIDPITDEKSVMIFNQAKTQSEVFLTFSCSPSGSIAIVNTGSTSMRSSGLVYRLDKDPAVSSGWNTGFSKGGAIKEDLGGFVRDMSGREKLIIRITLSDNTTKTEAFNLAGIEKVIDKYSSECGIK